MDDKVKLIRQLYENFNSRDLDSVLAMLAEGVAWANGMEGTHVHGPEAVREYWTHQWSVIDPHVEPKQINEAPDGSMEVDVHLTVRGLDGQPLLDEMLTHVFRFENGRVKRFDIRGESQLSTVHPST
ncbi:nuclear transport factor 2 family protein [Isosphaeraceae bacterium EP7]